MKEWILSSVEKQKYTMIKTEDGGTIPIRGFPQSFFATARDYTDNIFGLPKNGEEEVLSNEQVMLKSEGGDNT